MIDNLTPYIKMTPPVMKVAPPKMKMTHRSYCHLRFILLYQIRELDFEEFQGCNFILKRGQALLTGFDRGYLPDFV